MCEGKIKMAKYANYFSKKDYILFLFDISDYNNSDAR